MNQTDVSTKVYDTQFENHQKVKKKKIYRDPEFWNTSGRPV